MNILEVKNKYGVTRYEVYRNHEYVGYIVNRNTWGDEWVASSEQDAFLGRGKIFAETRRFFRDAKPKNPKYTPVRELPSDPDAEFFPTPKKLAGEMFALIDFSKVKTVLEPSAGKGDLIEAFKKAYESQRYHHCTKASEPDIDAIEIDSNLQAMLIGKQIRLVSDDFLSYRSFKRYDLVIMNPPFSNGDEHLLKAIELQENGGQIVCLLNAETVKNPYTNRRKVLLQKLADMNTKIRFVKNGFSAAERKSGVEVAIVYICIPQSRPKSDIFERMKKAQEIPNSEYTANELVGGSYIQQLIAEYHVEAAAGVDLIRQYEAMIPYMLSDKEYNSYNSPILELSVSGQKSDTVNGYVRAVRLKYWRYLFNQTEFTKRLTSKLASDYSSMVGEMCDYEFSEFNIMQIVMKMNSELLAGVKESILKLFDTLSAEHAWYPECKSNIHYYNGWKTNKAHAVGMKCIIPAYGIFSSYLRITTFDTHNAYHFLSDLERVLNYVNRTPTQDVNLQYILDKADHDGQTRNIRCKYFSVNFFKKGTCHIMFHNRSVVDALNIYVGKERSFLPPYYGKVRYEDLTEEDRNIVDGFQGKEAYDEVVAHPEIYLAEISDETLAIG